jgi:hypothetical protein
VERLKKASSWFVEYLPATNPIKRSADEPPQEVNDTRKELHDLAMRKRMQQLEMSDAQMEQYLNKLANVQREIRELRVTLETLEAKNKERVWLKNQTTGDVDDTKLIEGMTGERAIYKRRGESDDPGMFQQKAKRLVFSFDLSASMARFNGHDQRLDRSLELALMLMEAFRGFESRFEYTIVGHSGDSAKMEFVGPGNYPANERDCMNVLAKMGSHSQFCLSGDHTVEGLKTAMKDVVSKEGDDYFVCVLTDANLTAYGIDPKKDLLATLKSDDRVNAFLIVIGSIQDQAEVLSRALGGNAYTCFDSKDLPRVMKSVFLSSILKK